MKNREFEIYKWKYFQALRMAKIETYMVLILMALSVFFGLIRLQWGIGIINFLIVLVCVFWLNKLYKKSKEEKEVEK